MGKLFETQLPGKIYICRKCSTHLTQSNKPNKNFHGHHGRAYLVDNLVNFSPGPKEERHMSTGLHQVSDVRCSKCKTILGWTYYIAYNPTEKYKQGKFVIEKALFKSANGWDPNVANTPVPIAAAMAGALPEDEEISVRFTRTVLAQRANPSIGPLSSQNSQSSKPNEFQSQSSEDQRPYSRIPENSDSSSSSSEDDAADNSNNDSDQSVSINGESDDVEESNQTNPFEQWLQSQLSHLITGATVSTRIFATPAQETTTSSESTSPPPISSTSSQSSTNITTVRTHIPVFRIRDFTSVLIALANQESGNGTSSDDDYGVIRHGITDSSSDGEDDFEN